MHQGPEISAPPPPAGPPIQPPPRPKRLTRSSRERLCAGVAGGLAEYFELDPNLVRLIWVAAAVVSHGLAVPVYILTWIILPRDDRPRTSGPGAWRDWSQEFHAETHRLAEEARRMANEWHDPSQDDPWRTPAQPPSATAANTASDVTREAPSGREVPPSPMPPEPQPVAWDAHTEIDQHRHRPRSAGVLLVGLGVLLLAANAGIFSGIDWKYAWPTIFIGMGVLLLARQTNWFDR